MTRHDGQHIGSRDHLIDLLRVASLSLVIAMHWLSTHVWVDAGLHSTIALDGWSVMAISWVLQPMTVLFFTGGVANAFVLRRPHTRYAPFVASRTYALGIPVLGLIAVWTPAIAVLTLAMPSAVDVTAKSLTKPLWFLAVYPLLIAIAPLMLRAHHRNPWAVLAALGAAAFLVDASAGVGQGPAQWLNMFFVWAFCHQLGIVYAEGAFATMANSIKIVTAGVAAGLIAVLTTYGPYPPAAVGTATYPMSNLVPPTGTIVVLAVAQTLVIAAVAPVARRVLGTTRSRLVATANSAAMGAYLWHVPVLMALIGIALLSPERLLPSDRAQFWADRPFWVVAGIVLLIPALAFARWWSNLLPARRESGGAARSAFSAAVVALGVGVIWRAGIGINLWQLLGSTLLLAGCVLAGLPLTPHARRLAKLATAS